MSSDQRKARELPVSDANEPIDMELFCCSGGMAEGFRRAGIVFDLAFDANPNAVASYERNLGHRPVQMDVRDLVRLARVGAFRPRVRLLVADPPCTPRSTAGKRQGLDDERDMLRETCELIAILRPEAYLIGNVPGLEMKPSVNALQATIGRLAEYGYCVRDAITLDAADYSVPQHRVRPFWFGHLAGRCLRWPEPTHCDPRLPRLAFDARRDWVTCRDALGHLPAELLGRVVRSRKGRAPNPGQFNLPSDSDAPARAVRTRQNDYLAMPTLPQGAREIDADMPAPTVQAKEGRNARATALASVRVDDPKHPPSTSDAPAMTARNRSGGILAWPFDRPATTVYAGTNQLAPPGKGSPMSREWPWDGPATVVCADDRLEHPGHHGPSEKTIGGYVRLSEKAALILQGFPETWHIAGKTKAARWSQIGQAMPPPLAEAVARSIVAWFERQGRTCVADTPDLTTVLAGNSAPG